MNGEASDNEKPKLPHAVIDKAMTFMLAGFGFVAALAWNDAIQSLFAVIFGEFGGNTVVAKFIYAILVTTAITLVSLRLGREVEPKQ